MSRGSNDINPGGGHVVDALSAYIDGALEAGELESVSAHIADCGECQAEYLELRATKQMLSALPTVPPPRAFTLTQEMVAPRASFWDRVLTPRFAPRLATGSVLAFALLVMVLIGDLGALNFGKANPAVAPQATAERHSVSAGGVAQADSTMTTTDPRAVTVPNAESGKSMAEASPGMAASASATTAWADISRFTPPTVVTTSLAMTSGASPAGALEAQQNAPQGGTSGDAAMAGAGGRGDDHRVFIGPTESDTPQTVSRDDGRTTLVIVEATLALLAIVLAAGAFIARRAA